MKYRVHLSYPANSVAVRLSHLACVGSWRTTSAAPPLGAALAQPVYTCLIFNNGANESLINIRPRQNNPSMEILDSTVRERVAQMAHQLLGKE